MEVRRAHSSFAQCPPTSASLLPSSFLSSFRLSFGALCDKEGGQVQYVCQSLRASALCESLLRISPSQMERGNVMRGREVNAAVSPPASSSSYSVSNPNDYLPRSVRRRFDFPTLPCSHAKDRTRKPKRSGQTPNGRNPWSSAKRRVNVR